MKRVVVTGLGTVNPLGNNVQQTHERLCAGQSGIDRITRFDPEAFEVQIAGEVKDFGSANVLTPKEQRKMDRFIQYAMTAAHEAMTDAGFSGESLDDERFGVYVGSGIGGLPLIVEQYQQLMDKGPRRISPFFIPGCIVNLAAGQLSIRYGLKGPNSAVATACATGTHAIGDAFRLIQYGKADAMIAGGTESAISPLTIGGFASMQALSRRNEDPAAASRPFDVDRDGFVLGEGCGLVILESLEHAQKRQARIYGEVVGYAMTSDAHHITSPALDGDGAYRVMKLTLEDGQIPLEEVDLINAHGTSTPLGDKIEMAAIRRLFGSHADRLWIHSSKSMVGHLLGAAGGFEAVVALKALHSSQVHPTRNVDHQDPDCPLDVVPQVGREKKLKVVLSNSFGFGGTNAALAFRSL